jgi:hypothetical protein
VDAPVKRARERPRCATDLQLLLDLVGHLRRRAPEFAGLHLELRVEELEPVLALPRAQSKGHSPGCHSRAVYQPYALKTGL